MRYAHTYRVFPLIPLPRREATPADYNPCPERDRPGQRKNQGLRLVADPVANHVGVEINMDPCVEVAGELLLRR
jgi:hypothetical protein